MAGRLTSKRAAISFTASGRWRSATRMSRRTGFPRASRACMKHPCYPCRRSRQPSSGRRAASRRARTLLRVSPVAPGSCEPLEISASLVRLGHAAELHHARGVPRALEPWMATRDLRPLMEHQARVLLALGEEAGQVALV